MEGKVLLAVLSSLLLATNGKPMAKPDNKSILSGVFIPTNTFESLKSDLNDKTSSNNLTKQIRQNSNQELAGLKINPENQQTNDQLSKQDALNQASGLQQPIVEQQNQPQQMVVSSQRQPTLAPQNQPELQTAGSPQTWSVTPNQQGQPIVLYQQGQSLVPNQQGQPMVLVQVPNTQQPGQRVYLNQQPSQVFVNQQRPNQGASFVRGQPNQQATIVSQQPNQGTLFVTQPSNQQQILVGQQQNQLPIIVTQPGQQSFLVTPQGQQTIFVSQPNKMVPSNGQAGLNTPALGQTVVTVNGNQAILIQKPGENNVYTLVPINNQNYNQNQGTSNGNALLIPVQQIQQDYDPMVSKYKSKDGK